MTETLKTIQHMRGRTALFFDTETSGLPRAEIAPLSQQPCIVQIAWVLARVPKSGFPYEEFGSGCTLVRLAEGHYVDKGAEGVHHISTGVANTWGVPWSAAWGMFAAAADRADVRIAHNIGFDDRQIRWDVARERLERCIPESDRSEIRRLFRSTPVCTLELSRHVCQLPPTPSMRRAGRTEFKAPKLSEAYQCLTGEELEGAHDAMADVRGCMRVFEELIERGEEDAEMDAEAGTMKMS